MYVWTLVPSEKLKISIKCVTQDYLILISFKLVKIESKSFIFIHCLYRVRINYQNILQNHFFTNTEQKYTMLLQFERRMFSI
jgi:hypothetical protein